MGNTKYAIPGAPVLSASPTNETVASAPTDIRFVDNVGYQVNITGNDTPQMTLGFEVSLDYRQNSLSNLEQTPGNWVPLQDPPGTAVAIAIGATGSFGAQLNQLPAPFIRAVLTSAFTGNGVESVTAVADDGGSLNNTYFMIYAQDGTAFYVWFDVDGGGTDPMVAGATGIQVLISEDDTAAAVATALDTALNPVKSTFGFTSDVDVKTPTVVTVTLDFTGPYQAAADSAAAPTGFAFNIVTPDNLATILVSGKAL